MIDVRMVEAQLDEVLDPELDQPLPALGFIGGLSIEDATVTVRLRLPTFFCAANFAYMMAADIRDRVSRVAGVRTVRVLVEGHYAGEEISDGINTGKRFTEVFAGEADAELDELRQTFARKAFLIRQEQLLRSLLRAGYSEAQLARLTVEDARTEGNTLLLRVEGDDGERLWRAHSGLAPAYTLWKRKRAAREIPDRERGPLFTTAEGEALPADGLMAHLRAARMVRLNGAFNTVLCTGLARARYGQRIPEEQLADLG